MAIRQLTAKESIKMLSCALAVTDQQGIEDFVGRIWNALGSEGHDAIKTEFSECSFMTNDSDVSDET